MTAPPSFGDLFEAGDLAPEERERLTATHELLLRAGRADAAQAEFASSLQAAPRRAHSLLGLARANQALGNAEAARKAYEELAGIWASADAELPELAEARDAVRAGTPGD